MERELEKDLREIEYLIYVHKERENTHTQSVLERAHEIIEPCAKAARTLPELEELLSCENTLEITRSTRDNDGWIPVDDRLPEEYGEYLVTIVPSEGYLWAKRIIANFSDLMGIVKKPIFYTGEVGKIDFEDITDMVIAWRPLPEPYRPERSEGE